MLVLSGSADPADIAKARRVGACGYLTKENIAGELVPRSATPHSGSSATLQACSHVFSVIHVLLSASLIGLILMHSGRDAGLGGMGFTPTSQGGTHIVERNLTRLTIVIAVLFFANTVVLFRLLK